MWMFAHWLQVVAGPVIAGALVLNVTPASAQAANPALAAAVAPLAGGINANAATATVIYGDNGSINWGDPDVQPPGFILGQMFITRLRWSHWGRTDAQADGVIHVCPSSNGCTTHNGTMNLHQVRSHRGHRYFREMTLRWGRHVEHVTYSRDGGTAVFWH